MEGTTRTTLSKMVKKGTVEKRGFNAYGAVRQANAEEATPVEMAS